MSCLSPANTAGQNPILNPVTSVESAGDRIPFEILRAARARMVFACAYEAQDLHLNARPPGCGSVQQFATDCTRGEKSRKASTVKLLTVNSLPFAKGWQANCPIPRDAVSLAEHENDEHEGARGCGVASRYRRHPRLVCSHVAFSIERHSTSRPAYAIRKNP